MLNERSLYLENQVPGVKVEPIKFDVDCFRLENGGLVKIVDDSEEFEPDITGSIRSSKPITKIDLGAINYIERSAAEEQIARSKMEARGVPLEAYRLRTQDGQDEIEILNYSDMSLSNELAEISAWFEAVSGASKYGFKKIKKIIVLPDIGEKRADGLPANGVCHASLDAITLFPQAFQKVISQSTPIGKLIHTLTHEYFHQFFTSAGSTKFSKKWMTEFGWKLNFKYPETIAGSSAVNESENLIESNYGKLQPAEDFCEAGVKAIYNKGGFNDVRRRDFFDGLIDVGNALNQPKCIVERLHDPQPPKFRNDFTVQMQRISKE